MRTCFFLARSLIPDQSCCAKQTMLFYFVTFTLTATLRMVRRRHFLSFFFCPFCYERARYYIQIWCAHWKRYSEIRIHFKGWTFTASKLSSGSKKKRRAHVPLGRQMNTDGPKKARTRARSFGTFYSTARVAFQRLRLVPG